MKIAIVIAGMMLAQAALAAEPVTTPAAPADPAAVAAAAPGQAVAGAATEKPKKPKLICTSEATTGSILSKRVCRTPEQVEAQRQAAKEDTEALKQRMSNCTGRLC